VKIVKVDVLPNYQRAAYKHVAEELEKFLEMECKYARVELDTGDYNNQYSALNTFHSAIRTNGFPVKAAAINGEIYLIRKDM
jgi:hypothetical protein